MNGAMEKGPKVRKKGVKHILTLDILYAGDLKPFPI